MLYPFLFQPILKERHWGGRKLERLYQKDLPPELRIGESWELSDRPDDVSLIANGPLAQRSLRWLMEKHGYDLLGEAKLFNGRFPLLIKILDVQQNLPLQVHPSAQVAALKEGASQSKILYFTHSSPQAEIYLGLQGRPARAEVQRLLRADAVPNCFQRLAVRTGEAAFVPAGRVHAVGAGSVLFEIQPNAITTCPVCVWDPSGPDGQAHESRMQSALDSIDFQDNEPRLLPDLLAADSQPQMHCLVDDPAFKVDVISLRRDQRLRFCLHKAQVLGMVRGGLSVHVEQEETLLQPGQFCLIPAQLKSYEVEGKNNTRFLRIQAE